MEEIGVHIRRGQNDLAKAQLILQLDRHPQQCPISHAVGNQVDRLCWPDFLAQALQKFSQVLFAVIDRGLVDCVGQCACSGRPAVEGRDAFQVEVGPDLRGAPGCIDKAVVVAMDEDQYDPVVRIDLFQRGFEAAPVTGIVQRPGEAEAYGLIFFALLEGLAAKRSSLMALGNEHFRYAVVQLGVTL